MNELQQAIKDAKANTDPKSQAISALLANVEPVDLTAVCSRLGWFATERRLYPSQFQKKITGILSTMRDFSTFTMARIG